MHSKRCDDEKSVLRGPVSESRAHIPISLARTRDRAFEQDVPQYMITASSIKIHHRWASALCLWLFPLIAAHAQGREMHVFKLHINIIDLPTPLISEIVDLSPLGIDRDQRPPKVRTPYQLMTSVKFLVTALASQGRCSDKKPCRANLRSICVSGSVTHEFNSMPHRSETVVTSCCSATERKRRQCETFVCN